MQNENIVINRKAFLRDPALIFGLLFLTINLFTSYMLYHVNSFKILLTLVSVSVLALVGLWPGKWLFKQPPLLVWGVLSSPLLMTLPGFFIQGGASNYNFNYELVSNLILILWAGFFYQAINTQASIHNFLWFVGGCMVIASIWSFTSNFGFNPLDGSNDTKASFGHRNYFAGFLIIFLPIFFSLAIPQKLTKQINLQGANLLYVVTVFSTVVVILLIQSRAAIVGALISNALVILISILKYTQAGEKRKLLMLRFFALILIAVAIFFILYKLDLLGGKWKQVLSVEKWMGRIISWTAASNAIQAAPWFGHGLGSSYNLFFRFVSADTRLYWEERSFNHVHSEYLEYLEEAGLVGGLLFLIFWAYLFIQLYKLIKNPASPLIFKLSVGITGGLVAYLVQCIFSVAPRMMVVKLPFFTILGLIFVLKRINFTPPETTLFSHKSLRAASNFLPVFLILGLSWFIYLPWMEGQYNFTKIISVRPSVIQLKQLDKLVKKQPDIYALSTLAHKQISYKRWRDLRKTTNLMDQVIPYYRDLGYIKILLAKMEGDFARAIKDGRDSQAHDRYFIPSIWLMFEMAVRQEDEALFLDELTILTRLLVFKSGLQKGNRDDLIEVRKGETDPFLVIEDKTDKLSVTWSNRGIQKLMDLTRRNLDKGRWDIQEKRNFFNVVTRMVMNVPYFRDSTQYALLKNRQHNKLVKLKNNHNLELNRTTGSEQIELLKQKQLKELKILQDQFQNELETIKHQMKQQKSEQEYTKREQLRKLIVKNLVQIVFLPHLK
jgi:O-antigen ligase